MGPESYKNLANQAGDQIRKNYAAEMGVDLQNVQPVKIGVNNFDFGAKTARNTKARDCLNKLDDNATKNMNDTYSVAPNSNLWQIQQLHTSFMASGSQLTPFTSIARNVANIVFQGMDLPGQPAHLHPATTN